MGDDLEEAILKGKHVARILEDKVFRESVETLEEDLFNSWKTTGFDEVEKREFIYRQLKSIGEIDLRLRTIHENGKVAETMLQKLNKKLKG